MSEIIIPIKCSTVRKISDFLNYVLFVEFTAAAIVGAIGFIWFLFMSITQFEFVKANPEFFFWYYFGSVAPVTYLIVVNWTKYLPTISCIKDESERGA